MQLLHEGLLSHFNCGQRMGTVFLGAVLLQAAFIACAAWVPGGPDGYVIETLNDEPLFTRRRMIAFGIWTVIVVLVSAICMFTRTETLLWMDSAFVTETSCIGPFSDEYKLDRADLVVEHKVENDETNSYNQWRRFRRSLSGADRTREDNYLVISQPGKPRALFIELYGLQNESSLVALAPQAMQHYADHLRAVDEGQKRLQKIITNPSLLTLNDLSAP